MLQCEQCGMPLDEFSVEVCDECSGTFCAFHINVLDDDSVLCDTCAIEREVEEGNGED